MRDAVRNKERWEKVAACLPKILVLTSGGSSSARSPSSAASSALCARRPRGRTGGRRGEGVATRRRSTPRGHVWGAARLVRSHATRIRPTAASDTARPGRQRAASALLLLFGHGLAELGVVSHAAHLVRCAGGRGAQTEGQQGKQAVAKACARVWPRAADDGNKDDAALITERRIWHCVELTLPSRNRRPDADSLYSKICSFFGGTWLTTHAARKLCGAHGMNAAGQAWVTVSPR